MEYSSLKDWATIIMGQSPKAQDVNKDGEGLPLLNGPTEFGISHPIPVQYTTNYKKVAPKGSLLFCVRGSTTGRMNWADREYAIGRGLAAIIPNQPIHKYFLRSVIELELELLLGSATGSTFPNVSSKQLADISIPNIRTVDKLSRLLMNIDSKLTLNHGIIKNLEQISQTIFKRWFIDFEFPNEEGLPYKSSGGKMVDSELGEIPEGWKIGKLNDIYANLDSKRIPLSKLQRVEREKIYPYYGAATLMDYVDEYLFDGVYLLLGEDGTVVTKDGFPVLQYVWDKFWVNNHAHVMQGKNGFSTEYLYNLLKHTKVTEIITGAVQPKISQGNLNNIGVIIPNADVLEIFEKAIQPIYYQIRNLNNENRNLEFLRNTLLPKLLSGEIELPDKSVVN